MSDELIVEEEKELPIPMLDTERKDKCFKIARGLKKNTYMLRTIWLSDMLSWGIMCSFKVNGVMYDSINELDKFTVDEHVDLFKKAAAGVLYGEPEPQKLILN
jgi:hypothetical protein